MSFVKKQIKLIRAKDPSIKTNFEVFLHPSFKALFFHKLASFLYKKKFFFLARLLSEKAKRKTGIEIHPGATIGEGLFIDHGTGVVIGETAVLGENITLYHGVTLGAVENKTGKRHPTIKDNVLIGTKATILGDIIVHENVKVGAASVILKDVPPNTTVVGIPGVIVRENGVKVKKNRSSHFAYPFYKSFIDIICFFFFNLF